MREESAFCGHNGAVVRLDDLKVEARHADDLDVVGSEWFYHIGLSGYFAAETFVEFYGSLEILCEKCDMCKSCDMFHDQCPFCIFRIIWYRRDKRLASDIMKIAMLIIKSFKGECNRFLVTERKCVHGNT